MTRRNGKGWLELVRVPTQPLLCPAPFVDKIVSVVDQQLQLPERMLVRPRPGQTGLAQRGTSNGKRLERVRLTARASCTTFRCHQLRRHSHQLRTRGKQLPLERTRQLPAVLHPPQPLLVKLKSPGKQ